MFDKNVLTIIAMILFCLAGVTNLTAKHSDSFLLGVYSSLNNGTAQDRALRDTLCRALRDLGYNATTIRTNSADKDLDGLLDEMDEYGLDAIVNDYAWNPSKSHEHRFATQPVSLSNYMRFEAEFSSEAELEEGDALDNQFWYAARYEKDLPRQGLAVRDPGASHGWAWRAEAGKDKPGCVFTDLRYRWPNKNGYYVRVGAEFTVLQNDPKLYGEDHFWITYRFRVRDIAADLPPEEPLLSFRLAGYELSQTGYAHETKILEHQGKDGKTSQTVYRVGDHLRSSVRDEYVDLHIRVSYAELLDAKLLTHDHDFNPSTPDSREKMRLVNLNPRVFWHGNCDLVLDYVEIEDQVHHEMRTDPGFWRPRIAGRMQTVLDQSSGNIRAFYTFDEPHLGHFDSFHIVQEIAAQKDVGVMVAVYDYQYGNFVLDKRKRIYYDHVDAFRKLAKPRIIAPDIYPLRPEVSWNPENGGDFIQDVLDDKMLRIYRDCKVYRDEAPQRYFYPIVQVLGNWISRNGRDQWGTWIKPPLATQKALLYLPLCFGPDGILHYSLMVEQDQAGHGYHGILYSSENDPQYPYPKKDPVLRPAVSSTNHRVKEYGKYVKNLAWLSSEAIGTRASKGGAWLDAALVSSIEVEKQGNGEYEGYVQCGYYLDGEDIPHFMFVNRRGNYFAPGSIKEARYVPDSEYGKYFPEAEPQTLEIRFSANSKDLLGDNLALYDPVEKRLHIADGRKLKISLPAGEGRFYKLVGSLPEDVRWWHKIRGKTILTGDIELKWLSRVTQDAGSELILMPGTTLTVNSGAKLTLNGSLVLQGDARILVKGKLVDNTASVKKTQESSIVYLD
jgi:hypothetical protein